MRTKVTILFLLLAAASAPARAQSVWVAPATQKIRPADPSGSFTQAVLEAARNEFEAFHLVVNGGNGGAAQVTVGAEPLVGPGGARIDDVRIYREAFLDIATPSSIQGAAGKWPDPLVPVIDEVDNQPRNAFPVDVPAKAQQPVLVDYHVPTNAPAGWYRGVVHVTGGVTVDVPVSLYVHAFALPSTASLRTAFGIGWSAPCVAHYGSYEACGGDDGTRTMLRKYAQLALDHRISITDSIYSGPTPVGNGYDWAGWDAHYAPLLDGTLNGRLAGAKLTTAKYIWSIDSAHYAEWAKHFRARGWFDRTFDYTCDEPPNGCGWSTLVARAKIVHAGDPTFPTMSTTRFDLAKAAGALPSIDTFTTTVNLLDPMPPATSYRPLYNDWLAATPQHRLWMYQSCDSHGCNRIGGAPYVGWPSYMVDTPAAQNRAMEWQAWRQKVSGELYYDTTYAFGRVDPWSSIFFFGGNGDGTLFYPGTPAKIGGTSHVPIASLRMKLMREGQEDYEYLKLLADSGDAAMADREAAGLSPHAYQNESDASQIAAARHRIALRIEQLTGQMPPPMEPENQHMDGGGPQMPWTPDPSNGGDGSNHAGGSGCSLVGLGAGSEAAAPAFAWLLLAAPLLRRRRRR